MVNAWMPGAGRIRGTTPGGVLQGGAPRTVWLTTESDPGLLSAQAAAQRLADDGRTAHLVWNPVSGETAQLLPATRAAAGQLNTGAVDHAKEGRVCIVILVVGRTLTPFTDGPLIGLSEILNWLDSWEVTRQWPAGAPGRTAEPHRKPAGERLWARGGHFAHSQVPGARSDSPGAISPDRILNCPLPPKPPPPPRSPEIRAPAPRRDGSPAYCGPMRDHGVIGPPGSTGLDARPRVEALPS
ncbi:hypothetical protein [Allosalinactinospora lopnorensis]|uniref:hypothetical protein n=1 Tax=Allosalinactinospora lopnorensis TaxID=1352348 RepID=UPI0012E1C160|nr:hypothetical protein [Allosalinactinospora lopnorensis]